MERQESSRNNVQWGKGTARMRALGVGGRSGPRGVALWPYFLVCLFAVVPLLACENGECVGDTLPTLQVAGAHRLPSPARQDDYIGGIVTYGGKHADGSAAGMVLAAGLGLYQGDIAGRAYHQVVFDYPYCGAPTVTEDGGWVACMTADGVAITPLDATTYSQTRVLIPLGLLDPIGSSRPLSGLAWGPKGRLIAAKVGCQITIFVTAPPYVSASMVARLNVQAPAPDGSRTPCDLRGLTWSPAGTWMAFLGAADSSGQRAIYALPLSLLPRGALDTSRPSHGPVDIVVPPERLTPLGDTELIDPPAWNPGGDGVTFISGAGRDITRATLVPAPRKILLHQATGYIQALAWTPDGRNLIFAFGLDIPNISDVSPDSAATVARGAPGPAARAKSVPASRLALPAYCFTPAPALYVYSPA